ncbi:MAG: adenylosuccinate lyase family protein [Actinomycetota bacterium]|nr:adenylosuccinate lyase family protein [Actinomycetota bacterium]
MTVACRHERAHITDSRFHGDGYATPESRQIFCDVCRLQRWLAVEAALALSQAEVGLIPREAATAIADAADLQRIDLDAVREGFRQTQHSLVALLRALEQACAGEAGEYVHYGATTQDIQDTAQALEMRDVLDVVDRDLRSVLLRLRELALAHRDTLMVGRTHARTALPTAFGLKVACWIDELLRHGERLGALRSRVLVAELFGGVGTMAGFRGRGRRLLRSFADRLGLAAPPVAWHAARDRVAEFVATLAMLTATLARIADEVRTLARPEFGELEEGWARGRVGSSTMPHKRNPEACEQVVVLARLARAGALLGFEAMIQEHERDSRGLRLEWASVADVSHYTLAALAILRGILQGLQVHDDRMAAHAHQAADQICSEALMLALARHIGKQSAYAVVYELSQAAQDHGGSLRTAVARSPEVRAHLDPDELERIFDPGSQLGEAPALVDEVIAQLDRSAGLQSASSVR